MSRWMWERTRSPQKFPLKMTKPRLLPVVQLWGSVVAEMCSPTEVQFILFNHITTHFKTNLNSNGFKCKVCFSGIAWLMTCSSHDTLHIWGFRRLVFQDVSMGRKSRQHDAKLSSCERYASHARNHEGERYVNKHVGSWVCLCVSVEFVRHLASVNPRPALHLNTNT